MAVIKQRLLRKNISGAYDTIHLETSVDSLTGVLPVNKGGTGVTKIEDLGKILVDSGVVSGNSGIEVALSIGTRVRWAGYNWIVVHSTSQHTVLAMTEIYELCQFNANGSNKYLGSNLAARAMAFQKSLPTNALAKAADTTIYNVTSKIFVPTKDQLNGGFVYFKDNDSRICAYNGTATIWWTSTPEYGYNNVELVTHVNKTGGFNSTDGSTHSPTGTHGFRPFVALDV